MRVQVILDDPASTDWLDWMKNHGVTWERSIPFPMCGGIRLDGVQNMPSVYPKYFTVAE